MLLVLYGIRHYNYFYLPSHHNIPHLPHIPSFSFRNGLCVGDVRSAPYGHTLGGAVGLAMVGACLCVCVCVGGESIFWYDACSRGRGDWDIVVVRGVGKGCFMYWLLFLNRNYPINICNESRTMHLGIHLKCIPAYILSKISFHVI